MRDKCHVQINHFEKTKETKMFNTKTRSSENTQSSKIAPKFAMNVKQSTFHQKQITNMRQWIALFHHNFMNLLNYDYYY